MNKEIKNIFEEIDSIIDESLSRKPVPINHSRFLKRYKQLKERYKNV